MSSRDLTHHEHDSWRDVCKNRRLCESSRSDDKEDEDDHDGDGEKEFKMFCPRLGAAVKNYCDSLRRASSDDEDSPQPGSHVVLHCEAAQAARTVFGLTRDEIETLKSICAWNFALFVVSLTSLTVLIVLLLLNKYPFTDEDARGIFYVLGCLLIMHALTNFLGYASTQRENTLAIDLYCALNGIVTVCDIIILVYFIHYAEAKVVELFRSISYPFYVVLVFVCANAVLMSAATVVEIQIRTHGSADRASLAMSQSREDLLRMSFA